jgi:hypothetical protein
METIMRSSFPETSDSDILYLIATMLIDQEEYKDILKFLNIRNDINKLIEYKVLSNDKFYQEGIIVSLPSKRINEFTIQLTNDIVVVLNECQWFNVNNKQKEKIQKTIYDLLMKELQDRGIVFYKGVGFCIPHGKQSHPLTESEFEMIGDRLLKVVGDLLHSDYSTLYWKLDYRRRLKNNIYNVLTNTSSYSKLNIKSEQSTKRMNYTRMIHPMAERYIEHC